MCIVIKLIVKTIYVLKQSQLAIWVVENNGLLQNTEGINVNVYLSRSSIGWYECFNYRSQQWHQSWSGRLIGNNNDGETRWVCRKQSNDNSKILSLLISVRQFENSLRRCIFFEMARRHDSRYQSTMGWCKSGSHLDGKVWGQSEVTSYNPEINTDDWVAWKSEVVNRGMFYYVNISEEALEKIEKENCRLFYSIEIVVLK